MSDHIEATPGTRGGKPRIAGTRITVADIVLTKGKHLNNIKIVATTEYVVNQAYFTGGVVAGANIYTLDQDSTSINEYGVALSRLSDNRVTDPTTAHAIGSTEVATKKDEQYQTTVTIVDKTIDTIITAAKTGQIGDGKIFVLSLDSAVRIRTGETDTAAL